MNLEGQIRLLDEVTSEQRDAMFALMGRYYDNMDRAAFDADLAEKQWVIQVTDTDSGRLCGFSTQTLLRVPGAGGLLALYSGDTIMDQHARTSNALTRWWGRLVLALMDRHAGEPLYWFLISKGYKTYRFLPVFFNEFYPRYDGPTPAWAGDAIHALSMHKFPTTCEPGRGIVRAGADGCRLRPGVADITERRLKDPHVRFFEALNPGHANGDELCCIAPLTRENFRPAAYRAIGGEDGGSVVLSR